MSMRVHDLQHPYLRKHYKHGREMGPDPVNILLLASIFALSGFLFYSVVTTIRYVPAAGGTFIVNPVSKDTQEITGNENIATGYAKARATQFLAGNSTGDVTQPPPENSGADISGQASDKPWYEKPPYVIESLVSANAIGYRSAKLHEQQKNNQAGILKPDRLEQNR